MLKSNSIILIFATTLCLVSLLSTNAEVKVYQESLTYPNRRVIFAPYYYTDEKLVYALCNKNFQAYENHCKVFRRDHILKNETVTCDITLKTEQKDGSLGPKYEILPFGANKVIFISAEKNEEAGGDTFIKLNTIQMNTCKVTETKFHVNFPYEASLFFIVPYDDTFKLIFDNKAQCGNKLCVMTLDSNGSQLGKLSFISKSMHPLTFPIAAPMRKNMPDEGLFFIKSEQGNNYMIWKPTGVEKSFTKYAFKAQMTVLSTANDLIGVCHDMYTAKSSIVCTQHDSTGRLKFEFISPDKYEQLKLKTIYNLPGGGMLILAETSAGFSVVKIDASGKKVGAFDVQEFDCSSRAFATAASFYKHENEEYCVSIECREGNDMYIISQTFLNIATNCFTDADLTE